MLYFSATEAYGPLQKYFELFFFEELDEAIEEGVVGEPVPDLHTEQVVEEHEETDESAWGEVSFRAN